MKTLYLVRHAKSSWKDTSLRDHDRPLNKRGRVDAPKMAEYLKQKIACPDVFVSSPSRRTQDTAICFLYAFGQSTEDIKIDEDLFHGDENDIENVVQSLPENDETAMLFLHNPGITDYANELTKENIFNIPTCGVIGIGLETNDWQEINKCRAKKLFYFCPKGLDLHTL